MNEINSIECELLEDINVVCELLEKKENKVGYEKMPFIINKLSPVMLKILNSGEFNQEVILELLKDMMFAMENKDSVLLLDILRYGIAIVLEAVIMENGKES